jgi:geranylgeranyl pyrophosphate synthase
MDDLIDESKERRGAPSGWVKFGIPLSTISIVTKFFEIQKQVMEITDNNLNINKLFNRCMTDLYHAEGVDKVWNQKNYIATVNEYFYNCLSKNIPAMLFPALLLQHFSKNKIDLHYFVKLIGTYINLRDDYQCLFMDETFYEGRELFAEDLTYQKVTLPLIHAVKVLENKEIIGKM